MKLDFKNRRGCPVLAFCWLGRGRSIHAKIRRSEGITPRIALSIVLLMAAFGQDMRQIPPLETTHYPRLVHAELPLYPPLARSLHVSGKVEIEVTVEKGAVVDAQVKSAEIQIADPQNRAVYDSQAKAAASRYLSDPSLANLKTWQFAPGERSTFLVTYIYEIKGKETPLPENPTVELDLPRVVKVTARPFKLTCSDCVSSSEPRPMSLRLPRTGTQVKLCDS